MAKKAQRTWQVDISQSTGCQAAFSTGMNDGETLKHALCNLLAGDELLAQEGFGGNSR